MRLVLLLLILVVVEAFYNSAGGRLVAYFCPYLMLQVTAFVGLLQGPGTGLVFGLAAGFLEELYFAGAGHAVGLTPLTYCWTGWLCGKFFYGRADAASPALGVLITVVGLMFGLGLGAFLSWGYGMNLPTLDFGLRWTHAMTACLQVLWSPLLLALLVYLLKPRQAFE
ncbi:MAG: hypothetical protein HYT79_09740 [Elusimicrobia bacterium]|nr:hypothetical protein [Elusimicrobiota bacterium]